MLHTPKDLCNSFPGYFVNKTIVNLSVFAVEVFRSLDRLILNFPRFIVKLKPLLNCHETIVSIGLGGKWRHNETGTNTGICYAI